MTSVTHQFLTVRNFYKNFQRMNFKKKLFSNFRPHIVDWQALTSTGQIHGKFPLLVDITMLYEFLFHWDNRNNHFVIIFLYPPKKKKKNSYISFSLRVFFSSKTYSRFIPFKILFRKFLLFIIYRVHFSKIPPVNTCFSGQYFFSTDSPGHRSVQLIVRAMITPCTHCSL